LLTGLALVVILGIGAQWLAWRLRLPSILLLMGVGFAAGTGGLGWITPDVMFGETLLPIVSLSVALLLFEGGLTLRLRDIEGHMRTVARLVTLGALVTWLLTTVAAHTLAGLDWRSSFLIGAILVVTGPTVVGPLLRQIRPNGAVGPILRWEGILIDPVGAVLAVLVLEALLTPGGGAGPIALAVIKTLFLGGGVGILIGWVLSELLRRYWIPDHLHNAVALAMAIAAFMVGNMVQHEAGLLSVTLVGVYLANQRRVNVEHIVEFKENVQVLLIAALFVLMTARLQLDDLTSVGWGGVAFLAALVLVIRPISILVCTTPSALIPKEKIFLAAMAPRGIVAAAITSVFALRLGGDDAGSLVPLVFFVILGTVTLYGLLGAPIAYRLGLAVPKPQGILLLGAQDWARALAETLKAAGVEVLLADTNAANIRAARMAGLRTYLGSPISDLADEHIDLSGIGRLLALTPNDNINKLAALHYRPLFGRAEVFQLATKDTDRHAGGQTGGRTFGADYAEIARRFHAGARFRSTSMTEQFDLAAWRAEHGDDALPLLRIDADGSVEFATANFAINPVPGSTLVGIR
jgi:NhaP-type Na+/H+ or K+/H+ antiporter